MKTYINYLLLSNENFHKTQGLLLIDGINADGKKYHRYGGPDQRRRKRKGTSDIFEPRFRYSFFYVICKTIPTRIPTTIITIIVFIKAGF